MVASVALRRDGTQQVQEQAELRAALSHEPTERAILGMANGLGLGLVAEDVEREEQARRHQQRGCKSAQGLLMGRPAPPDAGQAETPPERLH